MSRSLMFMPLNPKSGRRTPYDVDEFQEQLNRHGIELPELDDGSEHYALQLPKASGFGGIEEEVMFLVEDGVVLAVTIDDAQAGGEQFWLQLIQMGYPMKCADNENWFVSQEWAQQQQSSGSKLANVAHYHVIKIAKDFAQYKI